MADSFESPLKAPPAGSWVTRRFQKRGLRFGRALVVAVPVSILIWLVIAAILSAV